MGLLVVFQCCSAHAGACPPGFRGTGLRGCFPLDLPCTVTNGGCDTLTTCSEVPLQQEAPDTTVCDACPSGYQGSGVTTCVEANACTSRSELKRPCLQGVPCVPTPCYVRLRRPRLAPSRVQRESQKYLSSADSLLPVFTLRSPGPSAQTCPPRWIRREHASRAAAAQQVRHCRPVAAAGG